MDGPVALACSKRSNSTYVGSFVLRRISIQVVQSAPHGCIQKQEGARAGKQPASSAHGLGGAPFYGRKEGSEAGGRG